MTDEIPLVAVDVLLRVDGHEALLVDAIVTDPGECGKTQLGMGLIRIGEQLIDLAARMERAS